MSGSIKFYFKYGGGSSRQFRMRICRRADVVSWAGGKDGVRLVTRRENRELGRG